MVNNVMISDRLSAAQYEKLLSPQNSGRFRVIKDACDWIVVAMRRLAEYCFGSHVYYTDKKLALHLVTYLDDLEEQCQDGDPAAVFDQDTIQVAHRLLLMTALRVPDGVDVDKYVGSAAPDHKENDDSAEDGGVDDRAADGQDLQKQVQADSVAASAAPRDQAINDAVAELMLYGDEPAAAADELSDLSALAKGATLSSMGRTPHDGADELDDLCGLAQGVSVPDLADEDYLFGTTRIVSDATARGSLSCDWQDDGCGTMRVVHDNESVDAEGEVCGTMKACSTLDQAHHDAIAKAAGQQLAQLVAQNFGHRGDVGHRVETWRAKLQKFVAGDYTQIGDDPAFNRWQKNRPALDDATFSPTAATSPAQVA